MKTSFFEHRLIYFNESPNKASTGPFAKVGTGEGAFWMADLMDSLQGAMNFCDGKIEGLVAAPAEEGEIDNSTELSNHSQVRSPEEEAEYQKYLQRIQEKVSSMDVYDQIKTSSELSKTAAKMKPDQIREYCFIIDSFDRFFHYGIEEKLISMKPEEVKIYAEMIKLEMEYFIIYPIYGREKKDVIQTIVNEMMKSDAQAIGEYLPKIRARNQKIKNKHARIKKELEEEAFYKNETLEFEHESQLDQVKLTSIDKKRIKKWVHIFEEQIKQQLDREINALKNYGVSEQLIQSREKTVKKITKNKKWKREVKSLFKRKIQLKKALETLDASEHKDDKYMNYLKNKIRKVEYDLDELKRTISFVKDHRPPSRLDY